MALSKKPVTGMKDILPEEMQIRDYVISVIKETYGSFGFTSIETPCVENIANLSSKQGGDNEKLIFKILKRGEKLNVEAAATEDEVVDSGLRYDLTVPLVRFYSNNAAQLPSPFKALQMGNVWRADRPQRGRYRQFMQCDIDILGEPSNLAEIELILATTTTLGKLGFKNFQIRINERRILKAMPEFGGSCGGGGRYDKMVGKFTGKDVPACGFSIGFERIILLLMESGFKVPARPKQVAYLIEKGVGGDELCKVIAKAQEARKDGTQVLIARMNKNKKFQKEQLMKEGYEEFEEFYKDPLKQ